MEPFFFLFNKYVVHLKTISKRQYDGENSQNPDFNLWLDSACSFYLLRLFQKKSILRKKKESFSHKYHSGREKQVFFLIGVPEETH
jgi:hypothetical protein